MKHTSSTVGIGSTTTDDLPVGKLVHSNTLRKTAWSGRSAERGNPDGHRGFLRGPLLSAAGPTSYTVAPPTRSRRCMGRLRSGPVASASGGGSAPFKVM